MLAKQRKATIMQKNTNVRQNLKDRAIKKFVILTAMQVKSVRKEIGSVGDNFVKAIAKTSQAMALAMAVTAITLFTGYSIPYERANIAAQANEMGIELIKDSREVTENNPRWPFRSRVFENRDVPSELRAIYKTITKSRNRKFVTETLVNGGFKDIYKEYMVLFEERENLREYNLRPENFDSLGMADALKIIRMFEIIKPIEDEIVKLNEYWDSL